MYKTTFLIRSFTYYVLMIFWYLLWQYDLSILLQRKGLSSAWLFTCYRYLLLLPKCIKYFYFMFMIHIFHQDVSRWKCTPVPLSTGPFNLKILLSSSRKIHITYPWLIFHLFGFFSLCSEIFFTIFCITNSGFWDCPFCFSILPWYSSFDNHILNLHILSYLLHFQRSWSWVMNSISCFKYLWR